MAGPSKLTEGKVPRGKFVAPSLLLQSKNAFIENFKVLFITLAKQGSENKTTFSRERGFHGTAPTNGSNTLLLLDRVHPTRERVLCSCPGFDYQSDSDGQYEHECDDTFDPGSDFESKIASKNEFEYDEDGDWDNETYPNETNRFVLVK